MWKLLAFMKRISGNPDWCWKTIRTDKYEIWVDIRKPLNNFMVIEHGKECVANVGLGYGEFIHMSAQQLHEVLLVIHDVVG